MWNKKDKMPIGALWKLKNILEDKDTKLYGPLRNPLFENFGEPVEDNLSKLLNDRFEYMPN